MVSLTSLVLTVTLVAVQLAMGQISPRIVRSLLQDRPSQLAIGLMMASIVALILYVHHAGQSLRAVGLIDLVGDNLRRVLEERTRPTGPSRPPTTWSARSSSPPSRATWSDSTTTAWSPRPQRPAACWNWCQ
jgi:uncharacterized membrane protein